ncbi:MAG: serine O-acetyltransferase [Clostridia bacterium]|nr:serine O-acetyltransferase [Clostridia bacterium]
MFKKLRADICAAQANDPAARNKFEILLTYSGIKALMAYRRANFFHRHGFKLLARMISQRAKRRTGIEIHPGATIAPGIFIDHGEGVVIGETAVVETGCVIYQGVTLGGTGKDKGKKRHPTIKHDCIISAGAKILGGITVHENCKIGASSVVLKDVPANSTVVGIPGKIIKRNGERVHDLEQDKRDPMQEEICHLREKMFKLEEEIKHLKNDNK